MAFVATLIGVESGTRIDFVVGDLVDLLRIFPRAWEAENLFPTDHIVEPMQRASVLRRMSLFGSSIDGSIEDYVRHADSWLVGLDELHTYPGVDPEDIARSESCAAYLRSLLEEPEMSFSTLSWSPLLADLVKRLSARWIDEHEDIPQESTILRTALFAFGSDEKVYVEIPQEEILSLPQDGRIDWNNQDYPEISSLWRFRNNVAWQNTKPIVLVEGRFDRRVIHAVLTHRFGDFADCVSVAEFAQGTEGSAAELRKILRTLARLDIPNTVLGLFDNDAAGHEGLVLLAEDGMPSHIGFACLPDLELAVDYPTIGPTGPARVDVNGRAASIEMYLGIDCLTEGEVLTPVEWTGYVQKVRKYQGSILDKRRVQQKFELKMKRLIEGRAEVGDDWMHLDLLIRSMLDQVSAIAARR
jgi:hypothetical protein